ncbi:MAG: hypothetical protein JSU63_16605 [Phycisphaerales bacterium]|nr:MAG: hypothetical protein JSU63_16605 [Phycisphaerales bacterium]
MTALKRNFALLAVAFILATRVWPWLTTQPAHADDLVRMHHIVRSGTVTFDFACDSLEEVGLRLTAQGTAEREPNDCSASFNIEPSSTLQVESQHDVVGEISGGTVFTRGALLMALDGEKERIVIGNFRIEVDGVGRLVIRSSLNGDGKPVDVFYSDFVMLEFDTGMNRLRLVGEVSLARSWAEALRLGSEAGGVIGAITIDALMEPSVSESDATETCELSSVVLNDSQLSEAVAADLGADVIVADLQGIRRYDPVGDITAFSIGTTACNIGTARANWISTTNQHPVISQNAYRLKDDRFEQIGLSWVKHGFYAVSESFCGPCLDVVDPPGPQLGVGCSDPYSASLNGVDWNLSPRSMINPHTGYYVYTGATPPASTTIERRLQIHNADIDPSLNVGARYFIQGHYVLSDDALTGMNDNNASYREVYTEYESPDFFNIRINPAWRTQWEQPAVRAWQDVDPSVVETDIRVPDEGLFILAAKAIDLGTGIWRYEYALQNLNSDRSGGSFSVSLPTHGVISNIGFHDVDYHSGDPYDPTDWTWAVSDSAVTWSTDTYDVNENANALRWGTVYNFRFDLNAGPDSTDVTIGLFKPGSPHEVIASTVGPSLGLIDCNSNVISDACDLSCSAPDCSQPCGASLDCDTNGVPDDCQTDCNDNDIPDVCDLRDLTSNDCDGNGIPDECDPVEDCNDNDIQDICDIAAETSIDCNWNRIPDECEPREDCNTNGIYDICDIAAHTSNDCDTNGIPDECEGFEDCNYNFLRDSCDIALGVSEDCNDNAIPDECESREDCNTNGVFDICDIAEGSSTDCNENIIPDDCEPFLDCNKNSVRDMCDISSGTSTDCNENTIPDDCEAQDDCNTNGQQDICELADATATDCDKNYTLDECDIALGRYEDCNTNDLPDACEIAETSTAPGGPFFCTEDCDPDCDNNGKPDECDILPDSDGDGLRDCEDTCPSTDPQVECVCPEYQDCCFPESGGWCYSDMGFPLVSIQFCLGQGGVPPCLPSPLCRNGCLVGDADDDGRINLRDVVGLQQCFQTQETGPSHADCLRLFDFDTGGTVDLVDFKAFQNVYYNGIR